MMKIDVFFLKRNDFSIVKFGRACVQKKNVQENFVSTL